MNGTSWYSDNVQFQGVLGNLVNGPYDLSASTWIATHGRAEWFDFHISLYDSKTVILFNLASRPVDYLMFLRPFSAKSWLLVLMTLIVITVDLILISHCLRTGNGSSASSKVLQNLGWMFFLLLHACYGGALTTNFIIAANTPFTSLSEGLLQYPTWQLCLEKGYEIMIQVHRERFHTSYVAAQLILCWLKTLADGPNPNPVYAKYWKKLNEDPDKYMQPNLAATLECFKETGRYIARPYTTISEIVII